MNDESENTIDENTCQLAMSVALEEASKECNTRKAKENAVANLLGLDNDNLPEPGSNILEEGPNFSSPIKTRQYVFARIFRGMDALIDEHGHDINSALNEAWSEVNSAYDNPEPKPEEPAESEPVEVESEPEPPESETEDTHVETEQDEDDAESEELSEEDEFVEDSDDLDQLLSEIEDNPEDIGDELDV